MLNVQFKHCLELILLFTISTNIVAKSISCPELKPTAGKALVGKVKSERFQTGVIHESLLTTVYNKLKSNKSIPYKYVVDGCDVRAYLGAKDLYESWGLPSFRVNFDASPEAFADTPYTAEGMVNFSKHSALALCVYHENTNEVIPYIFDISFFNQPVTLDQWTDSFADEFMYRPLRPYASSMFNLNPENRTKKNFSSRELECAEETRARFMIEQEKIEAGKLPYGVGRSKENLRADLCF